MTALERPHPEASTAAAGDPGLAAAGDPELATAIAAGELRDRHAALSATQVRFLDFAAREPECRDPASFGALAQPDGLEYWPPMQPWPLFLGPAKRAELARASLGVCGLVKQIPERVFGNDPERLNDYYGLGMEPALLISSVLRQTRGMGHAMARGDFLETAAGFKCCELNVAGNLGGWEVGILAEMYQAVPVLRRFLDEDGAAVLRPGGEGCRGCRVGCTIPARAMFSRLVEDAVERSLPSGGRLDLAFIFPAEKRPSPYLLGRMDREYRGALAAADGGLAGTASACLAWDLVSDGGGLRLGDRRIHLVIDVDDGAPIGRPLFLALMADRVRLYNGPASVVLSNKLNLALLSELEDSGLWNDEERAVIRAHVPWTRRLAEDFADFRGERVYLPDLLAAERDRLVLKRGLSLQGLHVHSGRLAGAAAWEELVRQALDEGGWLVQERLEPVPYLFQLPAGGAGLHDVVWGLFVFGQAFGGGMLRVLPSGRADVVNVARGARFASYLDVDD